MNKFWNWKKHRITNQDGTESTERVLELRGTIAEESWYADDVTPIATHKICTNEKRVIK